MQSEREQTLVPVGCSAGFSVFIACLLVSSVVDQLIIMSLRQIPQAICLVEGLIATWGNTENGESARAVASANKEVVAVLSGTTIYLNYIFTVLISLEFIVLKCYYYYYCYYSYYFYFYYSYYYYCYCYYYYYHYYYYYYYYYYLLL